MSLVGEAIRAGLQPCSYSLLILALVVLGLRGRRARLPGLGVYYAATILFAWIPFVGVNPLLDGRIAGTLALLAGLLLAGWRATGRDNSPAVGLAGVAVVGAFAGATWLPCVGRELGAVLTAATTDPWPGLVGLAVYLLGAMWIALVATVIGDYVPPIRRALEKQSVINGFRVVGGAIVLTVAVDLYPLLLSHLARLSSL